MVQLGGLHIIGTERHESRRIDNQLRGRSGRQGDPGSSRFYLSLEDDLLRIFGSERIQRIMDRLGMEEGEPIEHKLVTRAIGTAQKRVETRNFEIRKHLLEYDDVMNKQREIVYGMRREILEGESQEETVLEWIGELAAVVVARYAGPEAHPEDWDLVGLNEALHRQFDFRLPDLKVGRHRARTRPCVDQVTEAAEAALPRARERRWAPRCSTASSAGSSWACEWEDGGFRGIDQLWKEHLLNMDHLKEGIGLRGYGQRDPLTEYKKEAFDMFQEMIGNLKETAVEQLFKVRMAQEDAPHHPGRPAAPAPRVAGARGGRPRRRAGAPGDRAGGAADRRRAEGGPQRSVPLRLRQEVQEVLPPQGRLSPAGSGSPHLVPQRVPAPRWWGFFLVDPPAACY